MITKDGKAHITACGSSLRAVQPFSVAAVKIGFFSFKSGENKVQGMISLRCNKSGGAVGSFKFIITNKR